MIGDQSDMVHLAITMDHAGDVSILITRKSRLLTELDSPSGPICTQRHMLVKHLKEPTAYTIIVQGLYSADFINARASKL